MKEISLTIKNYGLVPDGEYRMEEGTVYFILGGNEKGKTTFLNGIKSIMTVSEDKTNVVRNGEKEGYILGTIPGADGLQYQVRYDFNSEGKNKFRFIRPDKTTVKTIGEMRAIFNYTHFTVSDMWEESKTEQGRKKQRDRFINLMDEAEKNELEIIDGKINGKNGTLFSSRTNINNDVVTLKKQSEGHKHTDEELKILSNGKIIVKLLEDLTKTKDGNLAIINDSAVNSEKLNNARKVLNQLTTNQEEWNRTTDEEIRALEARLVKLKADKITYNDEKDVAIDAEKTVIEQLEIVVDEVVISNASKLLYGDPDSQDPNVQAGIFKRIQQGQALQQRYNTLVVQSEEWAKTDKLLADSEEKALSITTEINTLRDRKKEIIKNSKSIPGRWGVEDDGLTYDGIPFRESDISLSKATRAIAELMIHMNQAPVMLMGDAEMLGNATLNILHDIAKSNGRIMVFAEHDRDLDDVQLVCYEDRNIPEVAIPENDEPTSDTNSFLF